MSMQYTDESAAGPIRLQALAANTSTVVWHTGPGGEVGAANPSWEAFTGQRYEEYAGWGWLEAVHPEDRAQVAAAWRAATGAGRLFEHRYRLRRHDGEHRHVQSQGTPVLDGRAVREWAGVCVDVTERHRAELALRRSELRYRFLDQLGQSTRALTDPGEVMQVTTRLLGEYLGASRCAYADVDADGDRFTIRHDWAHPGVASCAGVYSLAEFGPEATGRLRRGEHLVVRDVDRDIGEAGGARKYHAIGIKAVVCAALVKQGRLVALMAVHQVQPREWTGEEIALVEEVVERSWAHVERVRDLAERQRALLQLEMGIQAADLVLAEIDYRTGLNHLSGQLARLLELGDGPVSVPREAIFERVHPEDRDRYLRAIAATVDPAGKGLLAIDVRALLPSGAVRWMHIRLKVTFAVVDGRLQPDRGYCAARDVTAELEAQHKLHEAQRLAEAVMENAGALVYGKDLEGRYVLSNQAWRSQFGSIGAPEVMGLTDAELFGGAVAAQLRENDREVARTGRPLVAQEKVVLDGRQITYRSSKFPLHDEAGRVYAVCGVSTDITDVVEADRRKDDFIATLAHELRNPLAPIRNGLEILKRTPGLPAPTLRVRDMMDRQLVHMVRLVDDLLDVSRITRDKLEIRLAPVRVAEVVDVAVEASRPHVDAARHVLSVQLPSEPVWLQGDLTRLAQALSNLLNNAAKYTPAGGRIDLAVQVQGDEAVLAVSDNGTGIAAETLPRVFELFSQVDRTANRAQGGLGIGLWLVKRLVELHQGRVEAESAGPGGGSTFRLRLPRRAAPAPAR